MSWLPRFKRWGPVVFWAGVIFFLSSRPVLPPTGNPFLDVILPYLAHLTEFGVLFALLWRANKKVLASFLIAIAYAISDEYHQSFVPTRTPSFLDVFVDILGMVLSWLWLGKFLPNLPNKPKNWVKGLLTA